MKNRPISLRIHLLVLGLSTLAWVAPASAQSAAPPVGAGNGAVPAATGETSPATSAEQLFREGRDLFKRGLTETACEKFTQSEALEPRAGTRLNLAICNLQLGKPTVARRLLVALQEEIAQDDPRRKLCLQELTKAEQQIARITVRTSTGAECVLVVDEHPTGPGTLGSLIELDPGRHYFQVNCSAQSSDKRDLVLEKGSRSELVLNPHPLVVPRSAKPVPQDERRHRSGSATPRTRAPQGSPLRTPFWMLAGAGALALLSAAVNGLLVLERKKETAQWCSAGTCDDPRGFRAAGEGNAFSTVATASFTVGLIFTIPSISWLVWDSQKNKR